MVLRWASVALCLALCHAEHVVDSDSLQAALDAINRRQQDLPHPTYYGKHFHHSRESSHPATIHRPQEDDGQPEDIGYGYQKALTPMSGGVFEDFPFSDNELGSHDPGVESMTFSDKKDFEDFILDHYLGSKRHTNAAKHQKINENLRSKAKKSVFRERDINIPPEILQSLLTEKNTGSDDFLNEEPQSLLSSFRERTLQKLPRHSSSKSAPALVKNFGGLNRDSDDLPENVNDSDEYLSILNSIWDKYQDKKPDHFDPEDLSEKDVEEIMGYLSPKEVKRQIEGDLDDNNNYEFVNSPLAWIKRDNQRLYDNSIIRPSDPYTLALKHPNELPNSFEGGMTDDGTHSDARSILMEERKESKNKKRYAKRFWRGNTSKDNDIVKRFPVTKRSLSSYTSPTVLYHRHSGMDKLALRRKKHAQFHLSEGVTDPKVVKELSSIFSEPESVIKDRVLQSKTDKSHMNDQHSLIINNSTKSSNLLKDEINASKHSASINTDRGPKLNQSGQKEESNVDSQHKQLDISKKSVDWRDYFGIDKRQKKSKSEDDEWLLDQYLKAYSISARALSNYQNDGEKNDLDIEIDKNSSDGMDEKLRAMEDAIIDQAVKYTGAHEGTSDLEEAQHVKDKVIAQLAAAYSLEKMRKALNEFKSSMAAQKYSAPDQASANLPTEASTEKKDKRVSLKKENAENSHVDKTDQREEEENRISVLHSLGSSRPASFNPDESCPVVNDIMQRCMEIAHKAGDSSNFLVPLCNLHQICYLCGPEMGALASGCDVTFLAEAYGLCGDSPRCRYHVHRTLATMHSMRGEPSPAGCDWQNHPCLARYLAITMR